MQTKLDARYVFRPLLVAAILLTAGSVFAQERKPGGPAGPGGSGGGGSDKVTICHIPPGNTGNPVTLSIAANALPAHLAHGDTQGACRPVTVGDCKAPITLTLDATTPFADQNDFSASSWSNHVETLNYSGVNKQYLHTFKWVRSCGKIVKAELTAQIKANSAGASASSPDAGNDKIGIYHNHTGIFGEAVYSTWPFAAGTTVTKVLDLTPALAIMNQFNQVGMLVQDDSAVLSATLKLTFN